MSVPRRPGLGWPNPNKRVNVEAIDLDAEADYPHKNFKVSTPAMDADFRTPFQQRLKAAFTTPSSAKTVTPVSPRISAKRDMVHRLRQQLKNRDKMIMQMQTQILEQARAIHMHQLRMGDLGELIRTTNMSLFEAEEEVDYLRKLLADSCTCRPASCQVRKRAYLCNKDVKVRPLKAFAESHQRPYGHQHQDMKTLVSEARRLTEELKILGESKRERDRIVLSRAGEHEMNIRRISLLETELAEARQLALKNASLFESCERERARLSGALSELQQKLESQAIKLEHMRAYTNSKSSGGTAEPPTVTSDGHASNNIVNPGVPVCSSTTDSSRKSQFSNDSSGVSKPGSHTSEFLKERTPGRMVDGDIESLLSTLQQELDQLLSRLENNINLREDEFRPELQPSFQSIVSSSQVQELTSKFHQIAGLQASSMPELSKHRETILALNEKLSILSDNRAWNDAVRREILPETTKTSETPKDEVACRDIKVVFGLQNGFMFVSPDYRESSTNSQTAQRCGYANNWSLGEEVAQLSFEMEQVMVDDEGFGSPTCSMDESTAVRIGSPTITGDRYTSLTNSIEDTKGSFGRFVFDMDQENAVLMLNQADESCHETRSSSAFSAAETRSSSAFSAAETQPSSSIAALSPFSKMMAKLDLLRPSPAVSLTDSLIVAERFERSIGSVDSAFDRILDNTLDDMVRICSPCKTSTSSNSSAVDDQD